MSTQRGVIDPYGKAGDNLAHFVFHTLAEYNIDNNDGVSEKGELVQLQLLLSECNMPFITSFSKEDIWSEFWAQVFSALWEHHKIIDEDNIKSFIMAIKNMGPGNSNGGMNYLMIDGVARNIWDVPDLVALIIARSIHAGAIAENQMPTMFLILTRALQSINLEHVMAASDLELANFSLNAKIIDLEHRIRELEQPAKPIEDLPDNLFDQLGREQQQQAAKRKKDEDERQSE